MGVLLLWASWCFRILQPFFSLLLWGVVLAVAIHPLHERVVRWFGGRTRLAACALVGGLLMVVVGPVVAFAVALVRNLHTLAGHLEDGVLRVPSPPPGVADWPVLGERIQRMWQLAATNLDDALARLAPEIQAVGTWTLGAAAWTGLDLLEFMGGILIAGVLLVHGPGCATLARTLGRRLAAERGEELVSVAEATLLSVARGVMGVAAIQATLTGVGLLAAGVPFAGVWTVVALLLCIVQVGPVPVLAPAAIYLFWGDAGATAWFFAVWATFVTVIDNVLRPLLLGRGVDVPLAVILLGSIGGMLLSGVIGLFLGAVILALGHRLFHAWLHGRDDPLGADPTS